MTKPDPISSLSRSPVTAELRRELAADPLQADVQAAECSTA
ncbi:MAG: hypothetical protein Q8R72_01565 [Hylemonella sp.]|nr:hypothetical protein [Hylemonella sp.]